MLLDTPRFEFGKNWAQFIRTLDETQIDAAIRSLQNMLELDDLAGRSFLDIGSGSGLFSLAARRLGARVYSFDYDPASVACTLELKKTYFPDDSDWTVTQGSALDDSFMSSLGRYDVVYSWGVLHHTGNMWLALENVVSLCKPGGLLFLSIYNDQGMTSNRWRTVKRLYNRSPRPGKASIVVAVGAYFAMRRIADMTTGLKNPFAVGRPGRGMTWWRDLVDWVGGYPFEVAKPEDIFGFYKARGFTLTRLKTTRRHGCNEFVFRNR